MRDTMNQQILADMALHLMSGKVEIEPQHPAATPEEACIDAWILAGAMAVRMERERCAKLVDGLAGFGLSFEEIADKIRGGSK